MHPTTGWLLCQKMRLSLSSPLVSLSLSLVVVIAIGIIVKITPLPARNASDHRLVVVPKNEVGIVLALSLSSSLWLLFPLSSLSKSPLHLCRCPCQNQPSGRGSSLSKSPKTPPLPAKIHLTTGWLLCQKIRPSMPAAICVAVHVKSRLRQ